MGKVYRNLKDIPLPSIAYPDRHDGRVFIKYTDENGKLRRKIIGHMTDTTPGQERMVPNSYFKTVYQDLFQESYPDLKIPEHDMIIGLYTLVLAISERIELYSTLQNVYGMEYANNILDYAMYSMSFRSTTAQLFEQRMSKYVLFSDKLHSDSWYSVFFSKKISENQHHLFRIKWIQKLVDSSLKKVWLSIDGSNNDCEARQSLLTEFGFAKSHNKNKTIVGYMYAVDAETGKPVTYFVYEGSVPDSQAFQKMSVFLASFNIEIEGVILDRGFAVDEVFKTIEENKWRYVIMLPGDTYGHKLMMNQYSDSIRWNMEFALKDDPLFGISDNKKLFGTHERKSDICLFFDGSSGSIQSLRLMKKIQSAVRKAEKAIANGKRAAIETSLKKYVSIQGEGPARVVVINFQECNMSMHSKGFFSLSVSDGIDPNKAYSIYKKRDTSETQFSILKSQEGGDVTRVHKTEGIYSKFAILFITSIIRFEIEEICQRLELDTNPMIQNMDRITLIYTADDKYEAVRNLTVDQKAIFAEYGFDMDDLEYLAREYNQRKSSVSINPERKMPISKSPAAKVNQHRNRSQKSTNIQNDDKNKEPKSKGGRPKGKKDTKPRKPRSDKGIKRGPHKNTA